MMMIVKLMQGITICTLLVWSNELTAWNLIFQIFKRKLLRTRKSVRDWMYFHPHLLVQMLARKFTNDCRIVPNVLTVGLFSSCKLNMGDKHQKNKLKIKQHLANLLRT